MLTSPHQYAMFTYFPIWCLSSIVFLKNYIFSGLNISNHETNVPDKNMNLYHPIRNDMCMESSHSTSTKVLFQLFKQSN